MNEWSRRDKIALLSLIIAIIGLSTQIASSVINFFQDEIQCAMGLSCADNSRSNFPTVPPAIQPETADKAGTKPDSIPNCVEVEMAAQRSSELETERYDLERRIAHMKCIAAKADCNKDWNQGNTCYLEGRLLSRAQFDRELARMKLMIRQIK